MQAKCDLNIAIYTQPFLFPVSKDICIDLYLYNFTVIATGEHYTAFGESTRRINVFQSCSGRNGAAFAAGDLTECWASEVNSSALEGLRYGCGLAVIENPSCYTVINPASSPTLERHNQAKTLIIVFASLSGFGCFLCVLLPLCRYCVLACKEAALSRADPKQTSSTAMR